MKTLEQAAKETGVSKTDFGLNLHFSPIPNWYMKCGLDCPICDNPIDWDFIGEKPMVTNEVSASHLRPEVSGAELMDYGHRWLRMECNGCKTQLFAENFD